MIDYILAVLSAGLFAFLIFFVISFAALSLIAGITHILGLDRPAALVEGPPVGREQTA